jgi:hypothetical protein
LTAKFSWPRARSTQMRPAQAPNYRRFLAKCYRVETEAASFYDQSSGSRGGLSWSRHGVSC